MYYFDQGGWSPLAKCNGSVSENCLWKSSHLTYNKGENFLLIYSSSPSYKWEFKVIRCDGYSRLSHDGCIDPVLCAICKFILQLYTVCHWLSNYSFYYWSVSIQIIYDYTTPKICINFPRGIIYHDELYWSGCISISLINRTDWTGHRQPSTSFYHGNINKSSNPERACCILYANNKSIINWGFGLGENCPIGFIVWGAVLHSWYIVPCDSKHATSTYSLREVTHVYRQSNFCQD